MPTSPNICFMDNQYLNESLMTVSSIDTSYPVANMLDPIRSRLFKPLSNTFNILIDFKYNAEVNFMGMVGSASNVFGISESATIVIEANNINDFTSPFYSKTVSPSEHGLFTFLDDDTAFRYWKISITDPSPDDIEIGYFYMGDYAQMENRTASKGFSSTGIDPTTSVTSMNGTEFFDEKQKISTFDGIKLGYISGDDRTSINEIYARHGKSNPMFISIDPNLLVSDFQWEMTKFMRFVDPPRDIHKFNDKYTMDFRFRESV